MLRLACGRTLGPIQVAYETYGDLSAARDNAVLVFHALTGDAHAAGRHAAEDARPGWWDVMIGPGKGLDTRRYFVICANVLGGCKGTTGPSSINPATGKPWGLDFPVITIEDMVKVHKRLVEHLGIQRLLAVVGGSMGGMQALEWAVRYPDSARAVIAIATTARLNAQSIAFDAVGRNAILADANFAGGQYHDVAPPNRGLAIARMVGHITYLSEETMHRKFGRELRDAERYRYDFTSEFSVETYLDHQGAKFVERFDANSYLYITKAMDYYDLTARRGSLTAALADVQANFLVISFRSDWLFTPAQSRQIVAALVAGDKTVSYFDVDSPYGHDAFLLEPELLGRLIGSHLAAVAERPRRDGGVERIADAGECDTTAPRAGVRVDFEQIERVIKPRARVLDLGCGSGRLLWRLAETRQVVGLGVERDDEAVLRCIERGLRVIHGDLGEELAKLAEKSFDYVILSQTLPTLAEPGAVLDQMLRVGRTAIVSFANCAHWRRRLALLGGRAPGRGDESAGGADRSNSDARAGDDGLVAASGAAWQRAPQARELSIRDFDDYCAAGGIGVLERIVLNGCGRRVRRLANLCGTQAVYVLAGSGIGDPGREEVTQ